MNSFYANVYKVVAMIPEGKVASYGQIAAMSGNPAASRVVGRAMRDAPMDMELACHRVVRQTGEMLPSNTFGGENTQRAMLEKEGVIFKSNGRIDMKKCSW